MRASPVKAGRLPSGVSAREQERAIRPERRRSLAEWIRRAVAAAPEYRAGRDGQSYRVRPRACEMLERHAGQLARAVLRGGKCRKAPTYPEQATASSLRCAAVVHAASPSQMGRMQRISLGQRLPCSRKGEGTRACRESRERQKTLTSWLGKTRGIWRKLECLKSNAHRSVEGLWRQRLTARWPRRTGKRRA